MAQQQRTYSTCLGAGCGRLVWWVTTLGGKQMPMDPEPAPDGNVVLVRDEDGQVRGRVLTGADLPARGLAYRPHHRTCPDADRFRKRQPSSGPKCRAGCGVPMDPWLSDRGWQWHINCAPEPATTRPAARERDAQGDEQLAEEQLVLDPRKDS